VCFFCDKRGATKVEDRAATVKADLAICLGCAGNVLVVMGDFGTIRGRSLGDREREREYEVPFIVFDEAEAEEEAEAEVESDELGD
jgi:hypothetical protein